MSARCLIMATTLDDLPRILLSLTGLSPQSKLILARMKPCTTSCKIVTQASHFYPLTLQITVIPPDQTKPQWYLALRSAKFVQDASHRLLQIFASENEYNDRSSRAQIPAEIDSTTAAGTNNRVVISGKPLFELLSFDDCCAGNITGCP